MSTTLPGGRRVAGFSTIFWKTHGCCDRRSIFSRTWGRPGAAGAGASETSELIKAPNAGAGQLVLISVVRYNSILTPHEGVLGKSRRPMKPTKAIALALAIVVLACTAAPARVILPDPVSRRVALS